jgi:hypothetical protein
VCFNYDDVAILHPWACCKQSALLPVILLQLWGMVPDLTGGFHQLTSAYQDFVSQNMNKVLSLHTAIFVLT